MSTSSNSSVDNSHVTTYAHDMGTNDFQRVEMKAESRKKPVDCRSQRSISFHIQSFSQDLMFQIMEYLINKDQIRFFSCCREWLPWLKLFRQLEITEWKDGIMMMIERIQDIIRNPFNQLSVKISDQFFLTQLFPVCLFPLRKLTIEPKPFLHLMEMRESLRVRTLQIDEIRKNDTQPIMNCLSKLQDCRDLSFTWCKHKEVTHLPYLSSVQKLSLTYASFGSDILLPYCRTLEELILWKCKISDASMLGSIPHLELRECHQIVDISALNDNQHIAIKDCKKIEDYSHSFANSQKIVIILILKTDPRKGNPFLFDMTHWQQVKDLKLLSHNYYFKEPFRFQGNMTLPKTVEKCSLGESFVSAVNFTVTANHKFKVINLSSDQTITSFKGYGLEKVRIIELDNMWALRSLKGLGKGKNRKITIYDCGEITDFSPIGHTPIVNIDHCDGFKNESQVKGVRYLTITKAPLVRAWFH